MKGILNKKYLLLIFLIVLFILDLTLVISGNTEVFDNTIYLLVRNFNNVYFDNFFKFITVFGNPMSVIVILIVLNIFLSRKNALMCDVLSLTSVITNFILKNIIMRDRPHVERLIKQGGYSFPSGHAMISIMLYGYLFYLVSKYITNKKLKIILQIFIILFIICLCVSRIYVGVHFASDVIGGILLGLFLLIIILSYQDKFGGE